MFTPSTTYLPCMKKEYYCRPPRASLVGPSHPPLTRPLAAVESRVHCFQPGTGPRAAPHAPLGFVLPWPWPEYTALHDSERTRDDGGCPTVRAVARRPPLASPLRIPDPLRARMGLVVATLALSPGTHTRRPPPHVDGMPPF